MRVVEIGFVAAEEIHETASVGKRALSSIPVPRYHWLPERVRRGAPIIEPLGRLLPVVCATLIHPRTNRQPHLIHASFSSSKISSILSVSSKQTRQIVFLDPVYPIALVFSANNGCCSVKLLLYDARRPLGGDLAIQT
jgi:hypothetical protein